MSSRNPQNIPEPHDSNTSQVNGTTTDTPSTISNPNTDTDTDTNTNTDTVNDMNPLISLHASRTYWSSIPPTNHGMLGGYETLTTPDLKQSRRFISQVRRILHPSPSTPLSSKLPRAVDCGAGIGRITFGLLLKVAETVDVVEPIAKFAGEVAARAKVKVTAKDAQSQGQGKVGEIFVEGLETWTPPTDPELKYTLIWNQWCLGHLNDTQLVSYLRRASLALTNPTSTTSPEQQRQEKGWILIKENISKDSDGDIFDEEDSSVTRTDSSFRRIFEEAGLTVVRSARQEGFPRELYVVMMYALRPK